MDWTESIKRESEKQKRNPYYFKGFPKAYDFFNNKIYSIQDNIKTFIEFINNKVRNNVDFYSDMSARELSEEKIKEIKRQIESLKMAFEEASKEKRFAGDEEVIVIRELNDIIGEFVQIERWITRLESGEKVLSSTKAFESKVEERLFQEVVSKQSVEKYYVNIMKKGKSPSSVSPEIMQYYDLGTIGTRDEQRKVAKIILNNLKDSGALSSDSYKNQVIYEKLDNYLSGAEQSKFGKALEIIEIRAKIVRSIIESLERQKELYGEKFVTNIYGEEIPKERPLEEMPTTMGPPSKPGLLKKWNAPKLEVYSNVSQVPTTLGPPPQPTLLKGFETEKRNLDEIKDDTLRFLAMLHKNEKYRKIIANSYIRIKEMIEKSNSYEEVQGIREELEEIASGKTTSI